MESKGDRRRTARRSAQKAGEVISQLLETANPEYTIHVQEAEGA